MFKNSTPRRKDAKLFIKRNMIEPWRLCVLALSFFATSFMKAIRQLSGDDAYERYLAHYAEVHSDTSLLSRAEFFKQEQERKWNGVRRCC